MRAVVQIPIRDLSQAAEARRAALQLCDGLAFDDTHAGEVAIVVTEAGTNIAKHGQGGEILLSTRFTGGTRRLEMLAIDKGPGMDLDAASADGFSTTGTRGEGLGAIRRLAAEFDAFSSAQGTVVFAGFSDAKASLLSATAVTGSVRVPKTGEKACGDDWTAIESGGSNLILVADGLGHGPFAADAAAEAVNTFENTRFYSVTDAVRFIHDALKSTRGAAIAVAELNRDTETVQYCGLGNIAGAVVSSSRVQHMVSMNGTAGHEAHRVSSFQYRWPKGSVVIMHSDGLLSQWKIDKYPGLLNRHPSVIAAVLYRDFNRGRDDTTIVVAKNENAL